MENFNKNSEQSFNLSDNEINSLWNEIKTCFQPDKPTIISNTLKNTINEYIKYTYDETELSDVQRQQLVEIVSNNFEKNINLAKAQYYANQVAKYKSENNESNEYTKALANQNAYQQMAMNSSQKVIDGLNNFTSKGLLSKDIGTQALNTLEPSLDNIYNQMKPTYIPDDIGSYGIKDSMGMLGSLFKIAKMGKALYSNDANQIAKTGVSILGSMAAAAAAGAIAAAAGASAPAAIAAGVGFGVGMGINWLWDYFNVGEKLGLDPNEPAFDPFFGFVYDKTGWNGDLPNFGDWQHLNRDGKYHLYDPLVLDLDGDGIETVAAGGFKGAMFDHDKSGIQTATGWVKPDDGFLVVDRNGDGIINDGSELFGDGTILSDGSKATNGYQALSEFDSNGDGIINDEDVNFNQLKVWRDLNQDGISQENELFTLKELGIKSLKLQYEDTNTALGNGNILAQKGSYETIDGTERTMGDLNFMYDSLYSKFTNHIDLTQEQMQSANLRGIGRLRDLREAAALSKDLASVLEQYSKAKTKEEQLKLLDSLIIEWAKTDPAFDINKSIALSEDWVITSGEGIGLTPGQVNRGQHTPSNEWIASFQELTKKVNILNTYTGQTSSKFYALTETDQQNLLNAIRSSYDNMAQGIYEGLLFQTRLKQYITQIDYFKQDSQYIADYSGVATQFDKVFQENPLTAFNDLIELFAYKPEIRNEWVESNSIFAQYIQYAEINNLTTDWFNQIDQKTLLKAGIYIGSNNDDIIKNNNIIFGMDGNDSIIGNNSNNILFGGNGNDYLEGGKGNDIYIFSKGHGQDRIYDIEGASDTIQFTDVNSDEVKFRKDKNDLIIYDYNKGDSIRVTDFFYSDTYAIENFVFKDKSFTLDDLRTKGMVLYGTTGNDSITLKNGRAIIYGGDGNDTITTGDSNDVLNGGDGDDSLYAYGGDDLLDGGAGNDYLVGGEGNDTYVFAKGHGQDKIYDIKGADTIQFTDVNSDEVKFRKDKNDLIIYGYNEEDSIRVTDFFYSDTYAIENFVFKDKSFTLDDLRTKGMVLYGTTGNDSITLKNGRAIIYGGDGNDTITTGDSNDVLNGGDGDDSLYAYGGDDLLDGGAGNDYLVGGEGNDTYVFAKGHGQDKIYDIKGADTIQFTDVNSDEVKFRKDKNDLIIYGYNEEDSIRVTDFFYSDTYAIENFVFKDKSFTLDDLRKEGMVLYGTTGNDSITLKNGRAIIYGGDGNDTITTGDSNDVLNGGDGDDSLYAYGGDDLLDGGAGNDYLVGGEGNDTYVFAKGHGQDRIYDIKGADTIQFTDVNSDEVKFRKDKNDLIIYGYNEEDSIRVTDFFYSDTYAIENFVFKDKSFTLDDLRTKGMVLYGTTGNDSITLKNGRAIIYGGDGNDTITTGDSNDVLNGGDGDDSLYAYGGDDLLDGGAGNDYLVGGEGNDTYVFAKGHGQDRIYDIKGADTIQFTDVNSDEVKFRKDKNDLIIYGYNEEDSIRVTDFFYSDTYAIENFVFKDKSFTLDDLRTKGMVLYGTTGNDSITLKNGRAIIYGGDGNDIITTGDSNDVLNGGDGDDSLYAYGGDDLLDGGAGNDYLVGGEGNDTYVFAKGHGQDRIYDIKGADTIQFTDVNSDEVKFRKDKNDLIIYGYNEEDSIRVTDFFYSDTYAIENFVFKDKSFTLDDLRTKGMVLYGTTGNDSITLKNGRAIIYGDDGNDTITTGDSNDVLNGGDGDDSLYAYGGDDLLDGGAGNDYLVGGEGNDTYVFAKGHGQDKIYDIKGADTIQFTDVNSDEVKFRKDKNDLIIYGYNEEDSIRVTDFFYSDTYAIENFVFKDKSFTSKDVHIYVRSIEIHLNGTQNYNISAFNNTPSRNNILASQAQNLIMAMSNFTSSQNGSLVNSDQTQHFNQSNIIATSWNN
ncbi:calcium-binding protein [Snodgrassella alvi]|uniref:calcium-binding protein n=2 Tax=Snodgrassella TaxID=1193515 RepID=UPI00351C341E